MKVLSKIFAVTLTAMIFFCGCAKNAENGSATITEAPTASETPTAPTDIDLQALMNELTSVLIADEPFALDAQGLNDMYGIAVDDMADSACVLTMDGVFPDEIIVIKAKDADAKQRIKDNLQLRLDDVLVQSKDYDPENYALAQKCKISEHGDYIALFISAEHESMENIFDKAFK